MLQSIQEEAYDAINAQIRDQVFKAIAEKVDIEHQNMSKRSEVITMIMKHVAYDKRQAKIEERRNAINAARKRQMMEQAELKRKQQEAIEQQKERMMKQIQEQELAARAAKIEEQLKLAEGNSKGTKKLKKMIKEVKEGKATNPDATNMNVLFNQIKKKDHTKQKQKLLQERNKVDYGVRSVRHEEIKLLQAQWEEQQQQDELIREKEFDEYCRKQKKEFKKYQSQAKKLASISTCTRSTSRRLTSSTR